MKGVDLIEFHPKEIAFHMTVVSVDFLKAIAPDEFVFYIWGKKSDPMTPQLTQSLQKFIDRFNKVLHLHSKLLYPCNTPKTSITL